MDRFTEQSIYVGCALTHAPQQFKDEVERFKGALRIFIPVLDFVGTSDGTAKQVYETDMSYARKSSLFVAICDELSIGLGMEIQARLEIRKPLLLLWHTASRVTRMVSGGAEVYAETTMVGNYLYLSEDGPGLVREALGYFKLPFI